METIGLGDSDLQVSRVCLGSMTWGQQNTAAEGHAQLDMAVDQGINFIDTAEMYPVPASADTQGSTETILGQWLKQRDRSSLIVASKVAGHSNMHWIRNGGGLDAANIQAACDTSLQRLQCDYIDLYQVHWPDRYVNKFGERDYQVTRTQDRASILETMQTMAALIKAGKIRHYGVSNETPYGIAQYVKLAEQHGLPKPVSIQNCYNMLNRTYETHLLEMCYRENIPLLAYSPLAFGLLTGKYRGGHQPEQARLVQFPNYAKRYRNRPSADEAIEAYANLDDDLTSLALRFVHHRPFPVVSIIGATSCEQLRQNLAAFKQPFSQHLQRAIDAIHDRYPNPCP